MTETTGALAPFRAALADLSRNGELEKALQGRIAVDYYTRTLETAVRQNPRLLQCEGKSLLGAIMTGAQLGLLCDGSAGYGYIVPYWNKDAKCYYAQFQPGYRGYVQLAYRGGRVSKIVGREVCEGDDFTWQYGTDEWIHHAPNLAERGEPTHFYAVAWQKEGPPIFVVLPRGDVDAIRERAKSKNRGKDSPAWMGNYPAMGRKTAVRALYRWLPLEHDAHRAAADDERFDAEEESTPRTVDAVDLGPAQKSTMDSVLDGDGNGQAGEAAPAPIPAAEPTFEPCPACESKESPEGCPTCGGTGDVPAAAGPVLEAEWIKGEDARAEEMKT